ncbi:hypothetical protein QE407_000757 [Pantoea dispersa]|nr:hypothetical protein [Pantoea dispersa]
MFSSSARLPFKKVISDGIILFFGETLLLGKLRRQQHLKLRHGQLFRLFPAHAEVRSRCVNVLDSIELACGL